MTDILLIEHRTRCKRCGGKPKYWWQSSFWYNNPEIVGTCMQNPFGGIKHSHFLDKSIDKNDWYPYFLRSNSAIGRPAFRPWVLKKEKHNHRMCPTFVFCECLKTSWKLETTNYGMSANKNRKREKFVPKEYGQDRKNGKNVNW